MCTSARGFAINETLLTNTISVGGPSCSSELCSFNATELEQDTAYDFRVWATNNDGNSRPSDWLQGAGPGVVGPSGGCDPSCFFTAAGAPKLPPVPEAPTMTGETLSTMSLSWSVPGTILLGRTPNIFFYDVIRTGGGSAVTKRVTVAYTGGTLAFQNGVTFSFTAGTGEFGDTPLQPCADPPRSNPSYASVG